jgi:hypothetical protein
MRNDIDYEKEKQQKEADELEARKKKAVEDLRAKLR